MDHLAILIFGKDLPEFLMIYGPKFIVTIILSGICGLILGYEREKKEKPAGLRTLSLITMGSAAFVLASRYISGDTFDPGRIAAQVVTGVGFIGGGAIYRSDGFIQGVTTAATIWVAAAIGILLGSDHHVLGIVFTFFVYLVLVVIPYVEERFTFHNEYLITKVHLSPEGSKKGWFYLKELLERNKAQVRLKLDQRYLLVKISTQEQSSKQPLIECSKSEFVDKIETVDPDQWV